MVFRTTSATTGVLAGSPALSTLGFLSAANVSGEAASCSASPAHKNPRANSETQLLRPRCNIPRDAFMNGRLHNFSTYLVQNASMHDRNGPRNSDFLKAFPNCDTCSVAEFLGRHLLPSFPFDVRDAKKAATTTYDL